MKRFALGIVLALFAWVQPKGVVGQLVPTSPDCDYWLGVNVLNQFTPAATDCLGAYEGNDKHFKSEIQTAIGDTWGGSPTYLGSTDAGSSSGPFSSVSNGPSGTIVFDSPLTGDYVFALMTANQFSLYYFAGLTGQTQLQYYTLGTSVNKNDMAQGLSHASLYSTSTTSVPEPGMLLLLGTALFGMGVTVLRRREDQLV